MVKRRGFVITVAFLLIFSSLNLYLYFNNGNTSYSSFSGMIVKENPPLLLNMDISTLIFIGEWIILILIFLVVLSGFLKHKKTEVTKQDYLLLKQKKTRSETDLDVLYNLLKQKKKMDIETISKLFSITKEKALEWAKILENHELVVIEYPAFSEPEIKIKEEKDEEEKQTEKNLEKTKKPNNKKRRK